MLLLVHLQYLSALIVIASGSSLPACTECPPKGVWSEWTDATTCTSDCGLSGYMVQQRTCLSAQYGCPCPNKWDNSQFLECPTAICSFPKPTCAYDYPKKLNITSKKWYCQGEAPPTVEAPTCEIRSNFTTCLYPKAGVWSNWKTVGQCSATCGYFGKVNMTRTCLSETYGLGCQGSNTTWTECPRKPCAPPKRCNPDYGYSDEDVVTELATGKQLCDAFDLPEIPAFVPNCPTCIKYETSPTHPDCAEVGNGFTDIGGSCFKLIASAANFTDARLRCKDEHPDADLATIRSTLENQGVVGLVTPALNDSCYAMVNVSTHPQDGAMWIGLNDPHSSTNGYWYNGADALYRYWAYGEPDNAGGSLNESASQIYIVDSWYGEPGEFNDYFADRVICSFLCEVLTAKSGSGSGLPPCP